jgi:hypothetical protein
VNGYVPLYYDSGNGSLVPIGDYDPKGGFVQRNGHRVAPSVVAAEVFSMFHFTTTDWDEFFKDNDDCTLARSANWQGRVEALNRPDLNDKKVAARNTVEFLAAINYTYYAVVSGLASPASVGSLASADPSKAMSVAKNTNKLVQTGGKFANTTQQGLRAEHLTMTILRNQGRYAEIIPIKNASNNGIDIAARLHTGRWSFFEIKSSCGLAKSPGTGGASFVAARLRLIASRSGAYRGATPEAAAAASRILRDIGTHTPEYYGVQVSNFGAANQTVNFTPW